MERTISEIRGEHKTNDFTMNDEQYKLYQQQREQFSYTRDFLLTIRDSVAFWPKLPSVPELITEEETTLETKNEDIKFTSRGNSSNPTTFSRNRRREHSDRDWDQVNKDKHDYALPHDWRQEFKETDKDVVSRSDRDWKDKSDSKPAFRRDPPNSEKDKDWIEKKDRKEGWNYVGKTDFRSRRGTHTAQHETLEATENSESIVLGPPRKVFPSSQPGSNATNVSASNTSTGNISGPPKRHERNPSHRNAEKNYINFATERPPTKRTANAASKGARDASDFEQSKQKQFDSSESSEINRQDAAKSEPTNFVDSLFQSENSQKFSWDELMTAFNGSLSLPKTQNTKFGTLENDTTNDSDQDVDDPVSVTASRGFGRWFSPETQSKDTQKQKLTAIEVPAVPSVTGKQNVDIDNSGNILQELLQNAIQGNKVLQTDQAQIQVPNQQTTQVHPPSESESFIASLLSKPAQKPAEAKISEQYQQQAPPIANPINVYGRPHQYHMPQYPLHAPHASPTQYHYQVTTPNAPPANNNYFPPNVYQQQYPHPAQFHMVPSETSGSNLLEKLFGGVQGSVLPPLPQHGKVVSLEEIEKNQRK